MSPRWYAVIPNVLSYGRLALSGVLLALSAIPHEIILGQSLIVAGIISDKLDGSLARLLKSESDLGKRLESVADPAFGVAAALYTALHLGLPLIVFVFGAAFVVLANIGRSVVHMKTGKFFYQKSPLTRYGVGLGYVVIAFYVFAIPYREWVLWPVMAYGVIGTANYLRMMVAFVRAERAAA